MNRSLKRRFSRVPGQQGAELENHFLLRLPEPEAVSMRELLRSTQSSNIKDRLGIQLEHTQDKEDMRNGIITIDTRMHKARLVDLPTVMETWKTIDGKNFYKTADVCQMLMVREKDDSIEEEESKKRKRDHPNRVDKKYLWPHGYTPPLKNVRKRKFRKMLRKKQILELPEIEKEVKRLLRADEEAYSVKWEVVKEEEEKSSHSAGHLDHSSAGPSTSKAGGYRNKNNLTPGKKDKGRIPANLDEEQLFGEMLSSSEDEMLNSSINIMDEDEDSRMSMEDTGLSESYSNLQPSQQSFSHQQPPTVPSSIPNIPSSSLVLLDQQYSSSSLPSQQQQSSAFAAPSVPFTSAIGPSSSSSSNYPTEFTASMFRSNHENTFTTSTAVTSSLESTPSYGGERASLASSQESSAELAALEHELSGLLRERSNHEAHMDSLDNQALKSRFLNKLQDVNNAVMQKQNEIDRLRGMM